MIERLERFFERLPRPLDPFRSIKLKLSILLGISGGAGISVFWILIGSVAWRTAFAAASVGVIMLQIFAHGMTKPLREMTAAAKAMARGDYSLRVRATSRDEVGELARAFNVMAADLGAVDRQRRELMANVSHELRTPITALQGLLENMVDGVSRPDPDTLKTALAQTERLGRLVTELLDLSKVDAGAIALDLEPIDVAEFLTEVVSAARLARPNARFELAKMDGSLVVTADRGRLHQVFANLLDNAARHTPGGETIRVSAEHHGTVTVFEVADRGSGVPPHLRHVVFERFTRGHKSTDGGTGLGLAIARWVVNLHLGTIAIVDSLDGIGCRIRITLPCSGALDDDNPH